jgi:hypothetical protein
MFVKMTSLTPKIRATGVKKFISEHVLIVHKNENIVLHSAPSRIRVKKGE